jgi:hypothetical protein
MAEAPAQASIRLRHHPLWTRAFHSVNLLVLLVMGASGMQIYNAAKSWRAPVTSAR